MKRSFRLSILFLLILFLLLGGCRGSSSGASMEKVNASLTAVSLPDACRTTYEVFVYSFADSNGDGIGDLKGLQEKLPYITDEMGFSEIWLMPVFPSPTYHKYDAMDYLAIDSQYGTMEDFDSLLAACHDKGVRLILDLAVNHTSVLHPWFQQAAEYLAALPEGADPVYEDCPYVWYYNFTREPYGGCEPLAAAGLPGEGNKVLGDGSPWYYEARFWSGMPDLNLSTDAVREEIRQIASFWLSKGVDGFRLDALTSYYTDNTPASIEFTRWFCDTCREIRSDAYLVGECWTDQGAYAKYYESGIDSLFDFEFSGNEGVIASVVKGSKKASAYAEACAAEEALYASYNPAYVNAPFYTNHDMARSAGYYAYDDGSRTKLAQALNLMQTGNAFVYYGEELGMKGSGKDENKRAPMYWADASENAGSPELSILCQGPADMGNVEHKFGSLESQKKDPWSVWNYVRNAVLIRNAFPVIARGVTTPVPALQSDTIGAFTRTSEDKNNSPVLIVFNTGEESQTIDLSSVPYQTLSAVLTVSEEAVKLSGSQLTLPPFALAVLEAGEN